MIPDPRTSCEKKKCIICNEEFFIRTKDPEASYRRLGRGLRKSKSKTCSKKCSRDYQRRTRKENASIRYYKNKVLNSKKIIE